MPALSPDILAKVGPLVDDLVAALKQAKVGQRGAAMGADPAQAQGAIRNVRQIMGRLQQAHGGAIDQGELLDMAAAEVGNIEPSVLSQALTPLMGGGGRPPGPFAWGSSQSADDLLLDLGGGVLSKPETKALVSDVVESKGTDRAKRMGLASASLKERTLQQIRGSSDDPELRKAALLAELENTDKIAAGLPRRNKAPDTMSRADARASKVNGAMAQDQMDTVGDPVRNFGNRTQQFTGGNIPAVRAQVGSRREPVVDAEGMPTMTQGESGQEVLYRDVPVMGKREMTADEFLQRFLGENAPGGNKSYLDAPLPATPRQPVDFRTKTVEDIVPDELGERRRVVSTIPDYDVPTDPRTMRVITEPSPVEGRRPENPLTQARAIPLSGRTKTPRTADEMSVEDILASVQGYRMPVQNVVRNPDDMLRALLAR